MIIYLVGDSITQGYWDSKGGWADRIKAEVLTRDIASGFKYYHGVHNLGVDGNTTQQALERFDSETEARHWRNSEYGVVIAIGTNDTVVNKEGDTVSDPSRYHLQIEELLSKAKRITNKVAVLNLLPVNEELTNPLPSSNSGKSYTNDRIEMFNKELVEFCKSSNVELIDVRREYLNRDCNSLFADGLHPNDAGHEIIFRTVMPVIEEWLYSRR